MLMAPEHRVLSEVLRELSGVMGDLSDLLRKEVRLVQAEVAERLGAKIRAGVWVAVAAVLGLLTFVLLLQAAVFAIAAAGIAMHWASLIVALVLLVATLACLGYARALSKTEMAPRRALGQLSRDFQIVKERLT